MSTKVNSKTKNLALSVRQPLAELIMTGEKKIEYRSVNTTIRGRVYVYASKTPRADIFEEIGKEPGDFDVGVLVGTVEIIDCKEKPTQYYWYLADPQRLKKPRKPDNHPQPVWFKPFKK